MNINRSYSRGAIIAIVVMIGTISAAYAAPTASFVINGSVFYENSSKCNDPSVSITNRATAEAWAAVTNESSNHYYVVLDSTNVSANNTLRFKATSPDEGQSRTTTHVVTQAEMDYGGFVHDITLADAIPPKIHSVVLDPELVVPNGSISVKVIATDAAGVANVTANKVALALVNGTWEGAITAESTSGTYIVTVVATDTLDNVAEDKSKMYVVDATSPVITSVEIDPAVVAPNGSISVAVIATDAAGVASVTANEVALALVNGTWEGVITAESTSGIYNVTVVATDTLNNVAEDKSKTYVVDATSPVITSVVLDPAVVAPNGSISVAVIATDADGVASVTANKVALALVNGTWEGVITAESTSGTYHVTVVATDASGNEAMDNKTTYAVQDMASPEITSVEIDPAVVEPNGSISVAVIATDADGVASVTANEVALALVNGTWEGVITAESTFGTYHVTVVATDASGNEAMDNKTTYAVQDMASPEITSVEIDPAVVEPNGSISVAVIATDADGVASVTANEVALALVNGTWEGVITAESTFGTYNVTVVATDASGNEAVDNETTYAVRDMASPEITSVEIDPAVVAPNGSINVKVIATDADGVASVTANEMALALVNGTWEGVITAESTFGIYNVTVVATDASGNEAMDNKTTYAVRDMASPVITSVEIDPAVVEPNDPINVKVNVTDADGVASVTANEAALALVNGTWEGVITAESTFGTYNVTVVATDASGNEAMDNKTTYAVQDMASPVITSVEIDPAVVEPNGSISVAVIATDADGVASVTANEVALALVNGTWEGVITAESTFGTYHVTVVATDASGNEAMDNKTTYAVQDMASPEITSVVLDPAVVAPNGSISVAVIATDADGVASVTANKVALALVNGTWEGVITAESTFGTYNVTVVATDASGNEAMDNKTTYAVRDMASPEITSVVLDPAVVAPNGSINVKVIATDADGVASVTANKVALALVNGTWEGVITAESTFGTYNVTVVATDASGNEAMDNKTTYAVRDMASPVITSVVLDPAVVEPNGSISVAVIATDADGVASVTANEVALALVNGTWEGVITAESTFGTYHVTVVATDASGNEAMDNKTTYAVQDMASPEITSVVLDPAVVAPNGSISVAVIATDADGVASVTANKVALALVNGTWEGVITAESTFGTYNVTVVATDASGNEAMDNKTTYAVQDMASPVITSVEIDPAVVEPNDPINVKVNVTDADGVASVTANEAALALVNGTWEGVITAESTFGTYHVTVVATDASGNEAMDNETTYEVRGVPETTLYIEDVDVLRDISKTVPITVLDVMNMGGCEINFTYNSTVVHVTDVARGDMNFSFVYNINNGSGWMRANALDTTGVDGDVTFAYVTLTAVGNDHDVSGLVFEESLLIDPSYNEIPHITRNGTFTIVPNTPPKVDNVSATPATILYDNGRPRTPGTNLTSLSAHVTDVDDSIATVTIDLSSIGGLQNQSMTYVSDDVWEVTTNATEVAINAPDFTHQLTINATDNDGGINNSVSIELTVLKRGDVNGDGSVDEEDSKYISRYLAGLESEVSILVGDVVGEAGAPVGDGVVDLRDALYIAKHTDKLEEEP